MSLATVDIRDFGNAVGADYHAKLEGRPLFDMTLIEIRKGPEVPKLSWEPVHAIRSQPFSLIFESNSKDVIRSMVEIEGPGLDGDPVLIEPLAESKKGMIYQACFG